MYRITREPWGYRLDFGGFITRSEMLAWKAESEEALVEAPSSFGVLVDMHELRPLPAETQQVMVSGQQLYKRAGMSRSAVIVDSSLTAGQFRRLARQSGIYEWERYLSTRDPDVEAKATAWLEEGIDPDID